MRATVSRSLVLALADEWESRDPEVIGGRARANELRALVGAITMERLDVTGHRMLLAVLERIGDDA